MSSSPSSSALLQLNNDVLTHIVANLPIREQLALRGSCRRLQRVCDGDALWRVLCASGDIAPPRGSSWRVLGQRLSCHRWCYALPPAVGTGAPSNEGAALSAVGGGADELDDGRLEHEQQGQATSPELPTRAGPTGRWVRVMQSGLRYETFPRDVLPLLDTMAASRPLTNHKGNNTASIGLIPIGLHRPDRFPSSGPSRESSAHGGDFDAAAVQAQTPTYGAEDSRDAAVALHRKLFSAMSVEFTGDWDALCDVMRPRTRRAHAQPTAHAAQPPLTSDPTAPSLHVFDTMPHLGSRRVMGVCLSPGHTADHPNATAKLVETLFTTCSTVVFAAPSAEALAEWMALVSPHMSLVSAPSPFSTADNTPNVVFMTDMPIPSLREVFTGATAVVATPSSSSAASSVTSRRSSMGPHQQHISTAAAAANVIGPKELFSWVLNRSSCVGEVVFGDTSCPLSLKTFYAPAWVAPECSLPVPAPAIARMLVAAGDADGGALVLWTKDVVQSMCLGQSRQCAAFYEEAMRTEISDANHPVIAFTSLPVPMDPSEIVSIQDHFFYASLRSYAMAVRHACGSDTAMGMALLEEFKKDISTAFRRLWSENIATSRAYCTQLFDTIFLPVHDRYNGEGGANAFQDKKGLHNWFSAVTDKISEYVIKAKGPRKMDVLAERIVTRTIGGLKNFCIAHPEHPYVRLEDVGAAGAEISQYCSQQLSGYHTEQDEVLSVKQRNSAMYTACLGTMWASESVAEAIKYLTMLGPEYDTWAELLQLKREGFGLAPSAILSLTVSPAVQQCGGDACTSGGGGVASETNSVSESSEVGPSYGASSAADSRSRASSSSHRQEGGAIGSWSISGSPTSSQPTAQTSGDKVMSMLSSLWSRATSSAPPPQSPLSGSAAVQPTSSSTAADLPPPVAASSRRFRRLSSPFNSKEKRADRKMREAAERGECVLFTELEYERQTLLQDLVRRQGEHKQRMESVGKQFNLRSDQTADFNVIQRQFSHGFKDYRAARRVEDAADEIASKLRIMKERVRNSFASTRDR